MIIRESGSALRISIHRESAAGETLAKLFRQPNVTKPFFNAGGGKGGGGGGVTCVTDIIVGNVTTNSYVVPAAIMQEGHSYIFDIQALSVRDYDAINQQRLSYPIASSEVASAAITVAGAATKSAVSTNAKLAGGPKVGVNSAPSRMPIPSLAGSKSRSVLYRLPADALPKVESNQQPTSRASH